VFRKRLFQLSVSIALLFACAASTFLIWQNFKEKKEQKRIAAIDQKIKSLDDKLKSLDEYYQNEWYIFIKRCAYSNSKRGDSQEVELRSRMKREGYDELTINIMEQKALIRCMQDIG
jgi:hypothetical protein